MIVSPQLFGAVAAWQIDDAIIEMGMRVIAPAVSSGIELRACAAVIRLIASQKPLNNNKIAGRRHQIALASLDAYAVATDGAAHCLGAERKNAYGFATGETGKLTNKKPVIFV